MERWRTAAILVGGPSSRMGRSKAELEFDGRPFRDRIAGTLRERFTTVLCVGAAPGAGSLVEVPDDEPGSGPLGGVATALARADDGWVFVTSVDVPRLTTSTIDRLCRPTILDGQARVARVEGRVQPLVGAFAGDLLPLARERLEAEDRSMMAFLRRVPHLTLVDIDDGSLRNVNTPDEYAELLAEFDD